MPAESTLLAHLTPMLTERVEDIAVEALGYILSKSPSSRSVLNRVLQGVTAGLNPIKLVRTQVTGDTGSRPDLVGFDEDGSERVLIEAKFWAGLTENQPNGYLSRLPKDGPSVLLFIAPEARRDTLWAELLRRADVELGDSSEQDGLRCAVVIGSQRYLLLTSWRAILGQMANESSQADDSSAQIDIRQLQGLTERMDEEAFLPLQSTELAPEFPRRMLGLNKLVDDATNRGRHAGWISTRRLMVVSGPTGYGRYIRLFNAGAWFGIRCELWSKRSDTPLWLDFRNYGEVKLPEIQRRLTLPEGDPFVPIHLPVGVEYQAVLDAVVKELKSIGQKINPDYEL